MTGKILVPIDFGDTSMLATGAASMMARALKADLIVLYADSFLPPVAYADIPVAWYPENVDELKDAATKKLDEFVRNHIDPAVNVEQRIVADTPVHSILSIAGVEPVEMIVMGTHARSGWKRALLGSITESVLHETDIPMLTVRLSDDQAADVPHTVRRLLCPVNYSDVARDALKKAVEVADAFDAEIYVVHVVESPAEAHESDADALAHWIPNEFRHRCCYKELVVRGHAAEQVLDLARQVESDLIVMGAQHRRFVDSTVIGTTTDRIVRHAHCPVLTVIRAVGAASPEENVASIARVD